MDKQNHENDYSDANQKYQSVPLSHNIVDDRIPSPEKTAEIAHLRRQIDSWLALCQPLTAYVIRLHFGFNNKPPLSFEDIASEMDMTIEEVKQTIESAYPRLRQFASLGGWAPG